MLCLPACLPVSRVCSSRWNAPSSISFSSSSDYTFTSTRPRSHTLHTPLAFNLSIPAIPAAIPEIGSWPGKRTTINTFAHNVGVQPYYPSYTRDCMVAREAHNCVLPLSSMPLLTPAVKWSCEHRRTLAAAAQQYSSLAPSHHSLPSACVCESE